MSLGDRVAHEYQCTPCDSRRAITRSTGLAATAHRRARRGTGEPDTPPLPPRPLFTPPLPPAERLRALLRTNRHYTLARYVHECISQALKPAHHTGPHIL